MKFRALVFWYLSISLFVGVSGDVLASTAIIFPLGNIIHRLGVFGISFTLIEMKWF